MNWAERLRGAWNGPPGVALRRMARLIGRAYVWVIGALLWQVRAAWARANGRARVATVLIALILLTAATRSVFPSLSSLAEALAVLLVAVIGFWMILTSAVPRRRRAQ
jgi:hypothetical protein